jgi:hypothetical protein
MKRNMPNFRHPSREETSKGTKTSESGTRTKMRHQIPRWLYPFKEETLKDIQKTAYEARSSLSLALQILQW